MIEVTQLTATEGNDQFYPTPDDVAGKMLAGIEWEYIETLLEPSAGKGDLLRCAIKARYNNCPRHRSRDLNADCIEIDPYLRQILKYNFSGDANREMRDRYYELDRMCYASRTPSQQQEMERLRFKLDAINSAAVHIVHDDFLTYDSHKRYDLILMNPPFADGDLHLIKALEMQRNGGVIVCLLNAETIRNPCTNTRQLLMRQMNKYEAKVAYIEDAFAKAERRTDVDVAVVRVNIPNRRPEGTIYSRLEQAAKEENPLYEATDLVVSEYLEQMVQHYNVECAAGAELIREYQAMWPYMQRDYEKEGKKTYGNRAILTLTVGTDSNHLQTIDINDYLREIRLKYWRGLFDNEQFMGNLTSNLREQYNETVDKMADYDFTMYNIQQVSVEMNAGLVDGRKETIISLFDKLTAEHSWYPESQNNIHYFNGWKTNKAHKIGKKSIIPTHGMFSSYWWNKDKKFDVSTAYKVISDIEKVFNYLDGGITQEVDLLGRLKAAEANNCTRNIQCKYFKIDLFKKGTTHIKFTNMELVEKLNIYAARNRNWLPPNYGKKVYAEMTTDEKQVIDSFQGAAEYAKVLARKDFYLSEPTRSVPLLMVSEE